GQTSSAVRRVIHQPFRLLECDRRKSRLSIAGVNIRPIAHQAPGIHELPSHGLPSSGQERYATTFLSENAVVHHSKISQSMAQLSQRLCSSPGCATSALTLELKHLR